MSQRKFSFLWKVIQYPPQALYALGLGGLIGRMVLLLTTTGRKSGKTRVTPLQYEEMGSAIYVASARGIDADWFRNIAHNPHVFVRVGSRKFAGHAEATTDPHRIADFLESRLRQHPKMMSAILRTEGVPRNPSRADLEAFAAHSAMAVITPLSKK